MCIHNLLQIQTWCGQRVTLHKLGIRVQEDDGVLHLLHLYVWLVLGRWCPVGLGRLGPRLVVCQYNIHNPGVGMYSLCQNLHAKGGLGY